MKRGYYFLAPSLPPLILRQKPELTFVSFVQRLELSLSKKDMAKTRVLRLFVDLSNIRSLFLEEQIDSRGNLNEKELDEALLVHAGLPEYVFTFFSQFNTMSDRLRHFSGVLALFFQEETKKQTGFLRQYLVFEREVRLVLLGLRAKRLKRDLVKELQFEDPTDPFVAHLLSQKDQEDYEPPFEYRDLKEQLHSCYKDPLAELETLNQYRFFKLEEMVEKELFSIDRILCYMAQLMIVEDMCELDAQRGYQILDTFKS